MTRTLSTTLAIASVLALFSGCDKEDDRAEAEQNAKVSCTADGGSSGPTPGNPDAGPAPGSDATTPLPAETVPLKDAKLNIEHNATDNDTGFQGFIDSEGWQWLDVTGPDGNVVLHFEGKGQLANLGLTELFFETVEPANADVPLATMLAKLPEGEYTISGPSMENGQGGKKAFGKALLTHAIPAGPTLLTPAEKAKVPAGEQLMSWSAVTKTITGANVNIISYQLIVEKDEPVHPHMIGKRGLSMYLGPNVTSIKLPAGFLEAGTPYKWEVLAIEESGNQTLSSGEFETD